MEPIEIDSHRFTCQLHADAPAAREVPPGSILRIHCRSAADRLVGLLERHGATYRVTRVWR